MPATSRPGDGLTIPGKEITINPTINAVLNLIEPLRQAADEDIHTILTAPGFDYNNLKDTTLDKALTRKETITEISEAIKNWRETQPMEPKRWSRTELHKLLTDGHTTVYLKDIEHPVRMVHIGTHGIVVKDHNHEPFEVPLRMIERVLPTP